MPLYLGNPGKQGGEGESAQIGFCQRCSFKFLRKELREDEYIKGLLVCDTCWDPDHPQRYPAEPRPEGFPPLIPAPDQFLGPNSPSLEGTLNAATPSVSLSWSWPVTNDTTPDPCPQPDAPAEGASDGPNVLDYVIVYRSINGAAAAAIATVDFEQTFDFSLGQLEIDTTGLTYTDTGVTYGDTVSYYVVPYDAENNVGGQSNTVTFTVAAVASSPALSASASAGWEVSVTSGDTDDNADNTYIGYLSSSGVAAWEASSGHSEMSACGSASGTDVGFGTATAAFGYLPDGGGDVLLYFIVEGAASAPAQDAFSSLTWDNPSESYDETFETANAGFSQTGNSSIWEWDSGTGISYPVHTAFTVSGGSTAVDLSWTASTVYGSTLSLYEIYRSTDGVNFTYLADVNADTTSYTDSSVSADTDYWYYVVAVPVSGTSGQSNTVEVES